MSEASVSLDRALLGAGHTERVRVASLGGLAVLVRVLSPTELQSINVSLLGIDEKSGMRVEMEERGRVLHLACSMPDGGPAFADDSAALKLPREASVELWRAYLANHANTYDIDRAMQNRIEALAKEPAAGIEKLRAYYAAGLVAFYGLRAALDATTAQVLWFDQLMRPDK